MVASVNMPEQVSHVSALQDLKAKYAKMIADLALSKTHA
jgi:hypothetical protein